MPDTLDNSSTFRQTPAGIAIAPKLNRPDYRHSAKGYYSLKLRLSADDAAALTDYIDSEASQAVAQAQLKQGAVTVHPARLPYTVQEDGTFLFTFRARSTGKRKPVGPRILNDRGFHKPQTAIVEGMPLRVGFSVQPYHGGIGAGVALRVKNVQTVAPESVGAQL